MKNKNVVIICRVCGKGFQPHFGREKTSQYCSVLCYHRGRWGDSVRLVSLVCEGCGNQIITHKKHQRFCSPKCRIKGRIGTKNPGRSNRLEKTCDWCEKTFSRPASNFHSEHVFCCRKCSAMWWGEYGLHGRKHPNWNGGEYRAYTDGWKPLRRRALKRAGNKCQRCDVVGRLEVHHIKPVNRCVDAKEANRLRNVIVVCPTCHAGEEKISRKKYPQTLLFHL